MTEKRDTGAVDDVPQTGPIGLREWQQRCGDWVDSRWPDDTLEIRALLIAEEGGEIARCVVKGRQDIRGGQAHWRAESKTEAADLFFTLASFAHRAGFDLQDAIASRWEQLRDRQWPTGEEASYNAASIRSSLATAPTGAVGLRPLAT